MVGQDTIQEETTFARCVESPREKMKLRRLCHVVGAAFAVFSFSSCLASEWKIVTIAGTGHAGHDGDGGPAVQAEVNDPYGIVRGPDGAIWFCEHGGHRIRRISANNRISTIAGTGVAGYSGDGGPANAAALNLPHELRFGPDGALYVADTGNNVVRRIDLKSGIITTFAGSKKSGYAGDGGPAAAALFKGPHSIQFAPNGDLYVCDVGNHAIRRIDHQSALIETVAGTGQPGPTPDGAPLRGTPLNNPRSLDVDRNGNLWVATREGNQVFKLDLQARRIRLVAGTGSAGFSENGGPALEAQLSGPKGISLDVESNAWLADTESHSIRVIHVASGRIDVVAGTGEKGDGPEGDPLLCLLNRPHGVFADADGSILIGDSEAHRIQKIEKR